MQLPLIAWVMLLMRQTEPDSASTVEDQQLQVRHRQVEIADATLIPT